MLDEIQNCFANEKTLFSRHARMEMEIEEYGAILEKEVDEAIINGKIIENYPDDEPYPSCLVYGKTAKNRALHIVCAYSKDDNLTIIITAYRPDPEKWINNERRKI